MTTYISKWTVGALSFFTVGIMAFCWFLAAVCDPSWIIGVDTASELGASTVQASKVLFNIGFCVIGGTLIVIIGALYMFTKKSRLLHVLYGILIICGGIGLVCVGCNPLDAGKQVHDYYAFATGLFIGVLYVLATVEAWIDRRYFGAAVLTSGILASALIGVTLNIEMTQPVILIYFMILMLYFGIIWCNKEVETVVSVYGKEVKA